MKSPSKRPDRERDRPADPSPMESLGAAISEPVRGAALADEYASDDTGPLREIYHALKAGIGHERVSLQNVDQLIRMASRYGDTRLEAVLREWRAQCSDERADSQSTNPSSER